MNKPVLVTGGAGYVGSHTCKALARAGYLPVSYDNLSRGHAWAVQWGPLEVGDLHDRTRLAEVLARYQPQAVLHFAAYGYVGESMTEPSLYYGNNIANTHTLLDAMRAADVPHIVFSSSCATYGGVHEQPISEDAPQVPVSTYGYSKLVIERMLADYARAYGLRAIALRYFNAAGADPDGEIGEWHDPEPHIIPTVLRVAAGMDARLCLNGNDYPTPDGTCVRDFTHVSDLAAAHVLALQAMLGRGLTGAFNLGYGSGFSLQQIVEMARLVTGKEIPCDIGPRRAGDPPYAVGDARRAMVSLGWTPQYADIHTILTHAWLWLERYRNGYRPPLR